MKQQRRLKSTPNPFSLFLVFSLRLLYLMKRERRVKRRRSRRIRISTQPQEISPIAIEDCVFPQDVMVCILARLPVKSIIRFKSVCKPWMMLLSHQDFKELHRVQFSMDPRNRSYIGQHLNKTLSLFQIGSDQKKPTFLVLPFSHKNIKIQVVGCINGLVCLTKAPSNDAIYLWNPALYMSKKLVQLERCEIHEWVSLGFGYDAESDDFKVVRMVCVEGGAYVVGKSVVRVEVYSVNSDSWVSIQWDIPFSILRIVNDLQVNGTPYWVASVYCMPVLVYIDLTQLVLKFVPLIQLITGEEMLRQIYFDYNGCIGALLFHIDDERVIKSLIEVWVYDAEENVWTKNHTLAPLETNLFHVFRWTKNRKVIGQRSDGEVVVCDPVTGHVEQPLDFGQQPVCIAVYEYTESFIHINGMKQVKARKRAKKIIVDAAESSTHEKTTG